MKIAIVHDWLVTIGGAERVLEQMLGCFPEADIFSMVDFLNDDDRKIIQGKKATTSFIQRLPGAKKHYRRYLPFMPIAAELLDVSNYDLIISSSHAVAKGIIVGPDQLHICYCYSPMRYAWDLQTEYLKRAGLNKGPIGWITKVILHYMRLWDVRSSFCVDKFIAISHYIERRIEKSYRRQSTVIYPPVGIDRFDFQENKESFFITASRLVPYKGVPLIVEAFRGLKNERLIVIGDGPDFSLCKELAGDNVEILGRQPDHVLKDYMKRANAFIFAAEEDFGISPIEAQACGTPVIALARGAALETIRGFGNKNPSGLFFHEKTPQAIIEAVKKFKNIRDTINPNDCRQNALRFSESRFRQEFKTFVLNSYHLFLERLENGRVFSPPQEMKKNMDSV